MISAVRAGVTMIELELPDQDCVVLRDFAKALAPSVDETSLRLGLLELVHALEQHLDGERHPLKAGLAEGGSNSVEVTSVYNVTCVTLLIYGEVLYWYQRQGDDYKMAVGRQSEDCLLALRRASGDDSEIFVRYMFTSTRRRRVGLPDVPFPHE